MSYYKVWSCREKEFAYIKGSIEMSYQKLFSYLYMSEKKNSGIVTHFDTNELEQFKYWFMALGVSIREFKSACRPVLCVDGSFLKHKCG